VLAAVVSLILAKIMGWGEPEQITGAVIGAGGSVGMSTCHFLLSRGIGKLLVVGREVGSLTALVAALNEQYGAGRVEEVDQRTACKQAVVIIFAASSGELSLEVSDFQDGAILTDMARPRNVSKTFAMLLWLLPNDGAMVRVPSCEGRGGLGLPEGTFFPCWTELALSALNGWDSDWVNEPSLEELEMALAAFEEAGFKLAGLRLNEKPVGWGEVRRRKYHADKIREGREGSSRREEQK
jgi:predicted amino acid dehydrogenase